MPEESSPSQFGALLRDLVAWLDAVRVDAVVIGGLAAGILGRPRLTRDVDVLVTLEPERWPELLAGGSRFGFLPRVPDPLDFAERNRVLLLRHEPTLVDLDVSLGGLLFEEEAVARAVRVEVEGVSVPLVSAEDLLVMKAVAHRPRDLADIEGVPVPSARRLFWVPGQPVSVLHRPRMAGASRLPWDRWRPRRLERDRAEGPASSRSAAEGQAAQARTQLPERGSEVS